MVSHETIRDVLRNWKLENETLTDGIYDANGNVSESVCYVGENYIIKFSPNLREVENHISVNCFTKGTSLPEDHLHLQTSAITSRDFRNRLEAIFATQFGHQSKADCIQNILTLLCCKAHK